MLKFVRFLVLSMCLQATAFAEKITLTPENTVVLRGKVDDESVAKASAALLESTSKEVYLYITSPGGSVDAGLQLMDRLDALKGEKKVTCVVGSAASMAFAILQACHHRIVQKSSVLMQHVISYGLEGREPNNQSMARFVAKVQRELNDRQARRIGVSSSQFTELTIRDWWLTGPGSVRENVADEMATVTCSPELTKQRETVTVSSLFSSAELVLSGCPLIEGPLTVKKEKGLFGDQEKDQRQLDNEILYYTPGKYLKRRRAAAN